MLVLTMLRHPFLRRFLLYWVPLLASCFYMLVGLTAPIVPGFGPLSERFWFALLWFVGASGGIGWVIWRKNPEVVATSMTFMCGLGIFRFFTIALSPGHYFGHGWSGFVDSFYICVFWLIVITLLVTGAMMAVATTVVDRLRDDDGPH